jgi:hypothetical protein
LKIRGVICQHISHFYSDVESDETYLKGNFYRFKKKKLFEILLEHLFRSFMNEKKTWKFYYHFILLNSCLKDHNYKNGKNNVPFAIRYFYDKIFLNEIVFIALPGFF